MVSILGGIRKKNTVKNLIQFCNAVTCSFPAGYPVLVLLALKFEK